MPRSPLSAFKLIVDFVHYPTKKSLLILKKRWMYNKKKRFLFCSLRGSTLIGDPIPCNECPMVEFSTELGIDGYNDGDCVMAIDDYKLPDGEDYLFKAQLAMIEFLELYRVYSKEHCSDKYNKACDKYLVDKKHAQNTTTI